MINKSCYHNTLEGLLRAGEWDSNNILGVQQKLKLSMLCEDLTFQTGW